jgi:hypothetical protein
MVNVLASLGLIIGGIGLAVSINALLMRSQKRRDEIVKMGADLSRPKKMLKLLSHDRACVRMLERIYQQDRSIPILEDEVRKEIERLVKAFYDDKGD